MASGDQHEPGSLAEASRHKKQSQDHTVVKKTLRAHVCVINTKGCTEMCSMRNVYNGVECDFPALVATVRIRWNVTLINK